LVGAPAERHPVAAFRPVAILAVLAALLTLLTLLMPVWPVAVRIDARNLRDLLWLDGVWKQVSGFALLLLSTAAAVLSLRRRVPWLRWGDFATWRVIHTAIGTAALLALFLHTGFRLGRNLNEWLMLSFLGTAVAGSALGAATALEHRLMATAQQAARIRSVAFWLHIIAFWPLPLLLAVHVLTVYFY
jgi:nitrite reductase (NADH) large subunit